MDIVIRQESPNDYDVVYDVVKEAFASAEHSDGTEQELVVSLRRSDSFIPELSLVAVVGERVVGHIIFTKVYVGDSVQLALAPLAVLPAYQRQGIGLALIKRGHAIAKNMGYEYSVVLGSPKVYSKAGYVPASEYGIKAPFDVPCENYMAIKLDDSSGNIEGIVRYDEAFGIE